MITIIVLLILAVVSIRAITGDNILGKAETGKNKYEKARKNELGRLKEYEKEFNSGSPEIGNVYIGDFYGTELKIKFEENNKVFIGFLDGECPYKIKEKVNYKDNDYFVVYVDDNAYSKKPDPDNTYHAIMLLKSDYKLVLFSVQEINLDNLEEMDFVNFELTTE